MRLVYITCILFATTICCIANDNAGTTQGDTKSTTQQTLNLVNDTIPIVNSTIPAQTVNISTSANTTTNAVKNIVTTTTTDTVSPISTDATTVASNVVSNVDSSVVSNKTANDSDPITDHKLEPNGITTTTLKSIILSTIINSTTISEKAKNITTVIPTITNDTSNVTSTPVTPVVPVSKVTTLSSSSLYKGRHFDGLSFFGGIILAACLVAIIIVSNKLYKTVAEQSYHTL